jgi:hypothetical protein
MIQILGQTLLFEGFFSASRIGKTGLTVTCDVFKNKTAVPIVSGGAAIELGDGLYYYELAGASVDTVGNYSAVFKTTDSAVDSQHIPALWTIPTWVGNIGTAVALDGGTATLAGMLQKMADDNAGASFDATSDSQRGLATSLAASAPVAITAASGTATPVVTSGTYVNTNAQNSTYWQITASAAAVIDAQLVYACGTGKLANTVRVIGRYQVSGAVSSKFINVQAWNYKTAGWDTISSTTTRINGQTSSTDNTYTYALTVDHMSTAGAAQIRFLGSDMTANSNLYLDYVPYLYQQTGTSADAIAQAVYSKLHSVVYEGGIWIDTINGLPGTVLGDNGTPWNPVSNYADALVMAATLGVKRFYLQPDSVITLTQSHANWHFMGKGLINLNGQSIADAIFEDYGLISGTSTGDAATFLNCQIGSITVGESLFRDCGFNGTVTLVAGKNYTVHNCYDSDPSTTSQPIFVFAGTNNVGLRQWCGGVQVNNLSATDYMTVDGAGRLIIDSTCSANPSGTITVRGNWAACVDNVVGGFKGTIADTGRWSEDQSLASVTSGVTLTQTAAQIAAALTGSDVVIQRGDSLSIAFTGLGNISSRTKLYFTVKNSYQDPDSAAIIQIEETAKLVYLNGAGSTATNGGITIVNAVTGAVTVTLTAAATSALELAGRLVYDVQMITATAVTTLTSGNARVVGDVTRTTS